MELWSASAGRRFWRPAGCARFALLQVFDALRIQIFDRLRRIDGNDRGDLNATLCDAFEDIQQVGGSDAFYSHRTRPRPVSRASEIPFQFDYRPARVSTVDELTALTMRLVIADVQHPSCCPRLS